MIVEPFCDVFILPMEKLISVPKGSLLIDALVKAGLYLESPCGGQGICKKCSVLVSSRKLPYGEYYSNQFSSKLACRYVVDKDVTIIIPEDHASEKRKGSLVRSTVYSQVAPMIVKTYLKLESDKSNTLSIQQSIEEELKKKDIKAQMDLDVLRRLPAVLAKAKEGITLVSCSNSVIAVEAGNMMKFNYGIAFDVGTTTIVGTLMDLNRCTALGSESGDNPQRAFGADVISRISYANLNRGGLENLHRMVVKAINGIIGKLAVKYRVRKKNIYAVSFVGNTAMMHLLLNISPENLAANPYISVYKYMNGIDSKDLGIRINPKGQCIIAPNIAGFVGADTVGAVLEVSLTKSEEVKLLIDIGTNGEIVLGSRSKGFYTCSAAAGPAFEGAQIKFGMRAVVGAIEAVEISDDVYLKTVGGAQPVGICGSGLIDAVAELLRVGILNFKGGIRDKVMPELPEKVANRIVRKNNELCFILSYRKENQIDQDIVITQKDIRQVQLAKGAILAGIRILQKKLEIPNEEIGRILLAGAFGSYIKKESALRIGLLPHLDIDRITVVGNAAGAGAQKLLVSQSYNETAAEVAEEVKYVEISSTPDFTQMFLSSLHFPQEEGSSYES